MEDGALIPDKRAGMSQTPVPHPDLGLHKKRPGLVQPEVACAAGLQQGKYLQLLWSAHSDHFPPVPPIFKHTISCGMLVWTERKIFLLNFCSWDTR